MKNNQLRALALAATIAIATLVGPVGFTGTVAGQAGPTTWIVDAAGNGDYTAIQDAIENASAGDTIEVRAGNYGGFHVDKALTVRANGTAVVRADQDGQVVISANGAELIGLQFAGDYEPWGPNTYSGGGDDFTPVPTVGSAYDNVLIYVNASDVRVDGVRIDIQGYDTEVSGMVLRGDDVSVRNSTFLVPGGFHGGPIIDITADSDVAIERNTFQENFGGFVGADQTVVVRNNTFNGSDRSFGFTGPGFGPIPANATIDVGDNGMAYVTPADISDGTGEWWSAGWFYASASLQSMVEKLRDGGTGHVDAGTFPTTGLTIDRNITIDGAGPEHTTIAGGSDVIRLQSTGVTIRDVTITGGDTGIDVPTSTDASGFRLINAHLVDNGRFGMYVAGDTIHSGAGDNGALDDVLLRDVRVENHTTKGLYIEKLSNATFDGLVVDGVTDPDGSYNNGIDINLKDGNYTNVTIRDTVVRDVRRGDPLNGVESLSAAIAIKARDDGDYSLAPATLDGVALDNVTVRDSFNGLRFGEPGVTNAGPTAVSLSNSAFLNNTGYHLQLDTYGLQFGGAGFLETNNEYDTQVVVYGSPTPKHPPTVWANLGDALAAAEPGDVVEVTGGTYDEMVRFPADDLVLRGRDGATIQPADATIAAASRSRIVDTDRRSNVTLDGFTIVGNSNAYADLLVGVTVWGPNNTVGNLTVRNVLTAIQTASAGAENATIHDVAAEDVGVGISVQSNDTVVTDSSVDTAHVEGVGVLNGRYGVRLEGNRFANVAGPAVKISDHLLTSAGAVTLRRNDLTGGTVGVENLPGVPVNATRNYWGSLRGPSGAYGGLGVGVSSNVDVEPYYVDPTMTTLNTEYVRPADVVVDDDGQSDVDTITAGLAVAASGDTILVRPGTYDEDLDVAKNVTLTGYGATIDGRVDLQTDGVTLAGFTITNSTPETRVDGIRISVDADTADAIVVRDVVIEGLRNQGTTATVEGIHVFAATPIDGVLIENVTIRDIVQPEAGADGIKVQAGATNVTIRNATIRDIHGAWAYGVVSTPSSDLSLGVPTNVRVEESTFQDITSLGGNIGVGVGVDSVDGSLTDSGVAPGHETEVHNSSFVDLDAGVVNRDTGNVTDATLNYWGAANGPSGAGTGDGVAVSANVTYLPFLTAPGGGPPAMTLNRSTLAFGDVPATPDGSSPTTITVEITSAGDQSLKLSTYDVVGPEAGQFEIVDGDDPVTLAPFETHTVTVAFAPTARGAASANLTITTNAPGQGTVTVPLSGVGRAPRVDVTTTEPVELSAAVGDTDAATVTVENNGNAPLTLGASTSSNFSVTSPTSPLAVGASTDVTVTFAPLASGIVSGTLTLTTNDSFTPTRAVRLQGRALAPAVETSVPSGDTIDFGSVAVDSTVSVDVVVGNNGTDDLTINGVSTSGSVTATPEDTTIAPDESVAVNVSISPTAIGAFSESVTVYTNATTDPSWTLNATVDARELDVAGSVAFGNTPVGSTDTADLTVRNTGGLPLVVDLSAGIDDAQFDIVGTADRFTVPAGGARTVALSFTPSAAGAQSGTLTLASNDAGGADDVDERSVAIALTGTGTTSVLAVQGASTRAYGPIAAGATQTQSITVQNTGGAAVTGFARSIGGQNASAFTAGAVPATLAPGASVTVPVTYRPTAVGEHRARVTISGTSGTRATAVLTGTAVPPDIALNRTRLDLGFVATDGGTSAAAVRVSNVDTHNTALSVSSATVSGSGAFTVTSRPTAAIRSGGSAPVVVTFDPTADGEQTATLSIASNDPDEATRTVTLTGNGASPEATLSTGTLAFGDVVYGQTERRTVTLTNDGGIALRVTGVAPTGADAGQVSVVGGRTSVTLVPGASETYTVAVTPSQQGPLSASLAVTTNANDPSAVITANPIEPEASPSPTAGSTIAFGSTALGSASQETVTVENTGEAVLRLGAPTVSGSGAGAFSVVNAPETAYVAPGESVTYSFTFAPTATGTAAATLTFDDVSDPDRASFAYSLTGTGVQADARLSTPSVRFGQVAVGSSASRSLAVTNAGGAAVTVTDVTVTGEDAGTFTVTGLPTGTVVGSGGSQTFTVEASPAFRGPLSATLEVETDAGSDPLTGALGVTGVGPDIELSTTSVDFGETRLGDTADRRLVVNNTGNAPLSVTDVSLSSGETGQFVAVTESLVVPPKASGEIELQFAPGTTAADVSLAHQATARTATLTVESNDTDVAEQALDVNLQGTGVTPALNVSQKGLKYGTVLVGSTTRRTVTLRNGLRGTAPVEITGVAVGGPDASAYTVRPATDPTGTVLQPGESTPVSVAFTPQSTGPKFATLTVRTNDTRQDTVVVFLSNRNTIVSVTFGSVTMDYTDPVDGLQPEVDIYRGLNEPAQLDAFRIATTQDPDFSVRLDTSADDFGHAESSAAFDSIRYVEATTTNLDANEFQNATITFRVRKSALSTLGAIRSQAALYHYDADAGRYERLSTQFERETRTEYVYSATTTAFSEFSIGVGRPGLSLSNERLSATSIRTGQAVDVSVDVANDGDAAGDTTVTFEVDGSQVDTQTVTVAVGGSETATYRFRPASPGTYALSVNGTSAGTVVVRAATAASGGDGDVAREPTGTTGYPSSIVSRLVRFAIVDASPETPGTTVRFDDRSSLQEITFSAEGGSGDVVVTEFRELPADAVSSAPGELVHAVDITVPPALRDAPATLTFAVPRPRFGDADPAGATIVHRGDGGTWRRLDTELLSATDDLVVLRAETPGFSLFGVVLERGQVTPAPTETPTPTDTVTETPVPTATPPETEAVLTEEPAGFDTTTVLVLGAIILGLVAALALARRRGR
mgnify:CR=1 FL=1